MVYTVLPQVMVMTTCSRNICQTNCEIRATYVYFLVS